VSIGVLSRQKTAGPQSADQQPRAGKGVLLAVCCVAQFMVILDLSIVNVSLPTIQVALNFSSADLQWVIDAYAIVFAGFLMLAGRAADLFGHRRTFVTALLVFAGASLLGGASQSSEMLIFARGVQGLGGALMAASSLAIITSSFAAGPERHRAIALWGAMNGAGGAAGTLFSGIITQEWSWRWILLINVPIGMAAAVVAAKVVADRHAKQRPRFDFAGAFVLTGGLLILAYGGVTAGSDGWGSWNALVPLIVGNVVLGFFPLIESRAVAPLVPPKALTNPLKVVNLVVVLFSAALFPMWYMGSLYLQQVLSLSPIATGLTFLPMALAIFACASQAGKLVSRAGVRAVLGGGLTLMTVGLALYARIGSGGSAIQYVLLPGMLVAIGIGFSIVPSTIAATQSAKAEAAGLASGLVNTARQVGGGLGLAILISIATVHTSSEIGHGSTAPQALTAGFRIGYLIAAGLCAVAAVLTLTLIPRHVVAPGEKKHGARFVALGVATIVAVFAALGFGIPRSHAAPIGAYVTNGAYTFVSAPGLHPPVIQSDAPTGKGVKLPGDILMANFYDLTKPPMVGQSGPLILDNRMQPVWFKPVPLNDVAGNLDAQSYQGKPVLSYWQGDVTPTGLINSGEDIVVNQHYQPVATLRGKNGWVLTLHSFVIQGHDAWVTANKNIPANLSKYGGVDDGVYVDSAVQEYDLRTGKLVYSWDAANHVSLSTSHTQPPPNGFPWDAYHINSVDLPGNGQVLISMRNTWAAYLINTTTSNLVWTLGGKRSSFDLPKQADFEWQHDVELHGSTLTMFDDHCCDITGAGQYLAATGASRALALTIDQTDHRVTAVKQFSHGTTFESQYMGNAQTLPNGNVFVDWGQVPYFSEFTKNGTLLFDGALPGSDMTYRAYVKPWTGLPTTPPQGAVRRRGGTTTVYASWNGATQLVRWKVLAGASGAQLKPVATKARSGFETSIPVGQGYTAFKLQALDSHGHVIGTSGVLRLGA
jgi:EmrB/QacA subfamily drug resistance transporter